MSDPTSSAEDMQAAGLASSADTSPPSPDETGKMRVIAQETTDMVARELVEWLTDHCSLVGQVDDLGMGIYGIEANGPNGETVSISMTINPTQ